MWSVVISPTLWVTTQKTFPGYRSPSRRRALQIPVRFASPDMLMTSLRGLRYSQRPNHQICKSGARCHPRVCLNESAHSGKNSLIVFSVMSRVFHVDLRVVLELLFVRRLFGTGPSKAILQGLSLSPLALFFSSFYFRRPFLVGSVS